MVQHYKNPPIKEAILEVRVNKVLNQDPNEYENLSKSKLKDFPATAPKYKFTGQLKVYSDRANQSVHEPELIGINFRNLDKTRLIQFRINGFSYHILNPYTSGDELLEKAFTYWDIYKNIAYPEKIIRLSLRYINEIQIKITENMQFDFDDYFTCVPKIPKELPQILDYFQSIIQVPTKKDKTSSLIRQMYNMSHENTVSYIIDSDIFHENEYEPNFDVIDIFKELRVIKNEIFEGLITNKTRKLFQ